MAGQRKDLKRSQGRVVPSLEQGTSRVSSAADVASRSPRSRASASEQASNPPSRGSRAGSNINRQQQKSRGGGNMGSGRASTSARKGSAASSRVGGKPSTQTSSKKVENPRDSQFIQWIADKWNALAPHEKKRITGGVWLLISLLLFLGLTFFRDGFIIGPIGNFLFAFFGWAAFLFVFGLIAFSIVRIMEGVRREQIIRLRFVSGLTMLGLVLLLESRMLTSVGSVGVLADVIALPLLGWPAGIIHLLLFAVLILLSIFTFRITFSHVLLVFAFFKRLIADPNPFTPEYEADDGEEDEPVNYRGQRPRFSRYSKGEAAPEEEEEDDSLLLPPMQASMPIPRRQAAAASQTRRRPLIQDQQESYDPHEEGTVEFDPAILLDDEDPLNDINVHKNEVPQVRRGYRVPPEAIDLSSQTQGMSKLVKQPALPFQDQIPQDTGKKIVLRSPDPDAPPAPVVKRRRVGKKQDAIPDSPWELPTPAVLHPPEEVKLQRYGDDTSQLARLIQETLRSFRVEAEVRAEDISIGPTVIRFGIRPTGKPELKQDERSGKMQPVRDSAGNIVYETRTRVSRIMALQNDLALVLEAKTIRMEAPVPGRPYVGVEIPNKNSKLVTIREVIESKEYQQARNKSRLAIALGKDVAGLVRVGDLARMPHLLIAGATGAGKSVMVNALITSMLMQATPDEVRFLMVDPKMVELNMYNGIPHLLLPVVTEVDMVVSLLKNAISEMERRYRLFSKLGVRNLDGYRRLRLEKLAEEDTSLSNLPAIVIIIDELADLMMAAPEEVESMICRLAQLARATGIHLVVATQRPSVDVITGLIKANIPTRISFMVSSSVDSRTIIDMGGAERLLGRGDMLYLPADAGRPERIQGSFVTDDETQALVQFWRQQVLEHASATIKDEGEGLQANYAGMGAEPGWELKGEQESEDSLEDDLFDKAEDVVREYGKASISLLQRRLKVGYSRAARLIDLLEDHGVIGPAEAGGRSREVYDGGGNSQFGEAHSMGDEVDDIVAEERARDEFLRKQQQQQQAPPPRASRRRTYEEE